MFRDNTLKDELVKPSDWKGKDVHEEDILCAAIMKNIPMLMATASFDGEIVVWNSVTELPHKRLTARKRAHISKPTKEVSFIALTPTFNAYQRDLGLIIRFTDKVLSSFFRLNFRLANPVYNLNLNDNLKIQIRFQI